MEWKRLGSALPAFALLLAVSGPVARSAAPAWADGGACGIAPWTGTCACEIDHRTMPLGDYVALLRAAGTPAAERVLRAEQQSCHVSGRTAAATTTAEPASPPPG